MNQDHEVREFNRRWDERNQAETRRGKRWRTERLAALQDEREDLRRRQERDELPPLEALPPVDEPRLSPEEYAARNDLWGRDARLRARREANQRRENAA